MSRCRCICSYCLSLCGLLLHAGPGGATRDERLGDVGLVVLDEVHYLGDPWRGSVWEEVIINCPKHIQLLCMSATVKNPDDLGGWISQVSGWGPKVLCGPAKPGRLFERERNRAPL